MSYLCKMVEYAIYTAIFQIKNKCNNIDVDPQLIFLRELVILNGCEGSQAAFKIDASTSLSMTFKRWVNCYIVTKTNAIYEGRNAKRLRCPRGEIC